MTSPLGKLEECLKTHVDETTANLFLRKAAALDQVPGELLRDLVYLDVHGVTLLEMTAKHRRKLLEAQGLNQGQGRAE